MKERRRKVDGEKDRRKRKERYEERQKERRKENKRAKMALDCSPEFLKLP